jgi:hypothetical protein
MRKHLIVQSSQKCNGTMSTSADNEKKTAVAAIAI